MGGPTTTREALMAELLGDVGDLLDRVDALRASIPAASDAAVEAIRAQGEDIAATLQTAASDLQAERLRERAASKQELQTMTKTIAAAANAVTDGVQRSAIVAALIGAGAGALAGALTATLVAMLIP